jgi:hypothetical protein
LAGLRQRQEQARRHYEELNMGFFRFRRSFGLLPGLRLNIGKRSASLSVGVRGAHVTFGKSGARTTVGLPGTGLSYTEVVPYQQHDGTAPGTPTDCAPGSSVPSRSSSSRGFWSLALLIVVIAVLAARMR